MAQRVIILGGGIAGMSAAHELIGRGFEVEVYEQKAIPGGKARSMPAKNSGTDGRKDLPGEHGFRFFPNFYRHLFDTMKRTPIGDKGKTAFDNLVETTKLEVARYDRRPVTLLVRSPRSLRDMETVLKGMLVEMLGSNIGVSDAELEFFFRRIWQFMTSCEERRLQEYEKISWWQFIAADKHSQAYQKYFGRGLTRMLVAARGNEASARTIGDIFVQLMFGMILPGPSSDRVLNGPTNEVWIDPWLQYLRTRGVKYHLNSTVENINMDGESVGSVTVKRTPESSEQQTFDVSGDYYISALPLEIMSDLTTPKMLDIEPDFMRLKELKDHSIDWMTGMQIFLNQDVKIVPGHAIYIDTPWALTSISQKQFWSEIDLSQYGDGMVQGILSIDISDWDTKGSYGKSARECTPDEIFREVWLQLKRSLNLEGDKELTDSHLHRVDDKPSYFLDPDIIFDPTTNLAIENKEPLLINKRNTWHMRPKAYTEIRNLFLAADYVQTNTDLATMEAANEAARRAVNAVIEASDISTYHCRIWKLYEPRILEPWRIRDYVRYRLGLPWAGTIVSQPIKWLLAIKNAIFSRLLGL